LKLLLLGNYLASQKNPKNESYFFSRGIKLDGQQLYLTIEGFHQIFKCNIQNGTLLSKWGAEIEGTSQALGNPMGITVDNKYVSVCDYNNNRILFVTKDEGKCITEWGSSFIHPRSIYYHLPAETYYIGDENVVQIFAKDGSYQRRLSGQVVAIGICVINERLWISSGSQRMLIFRRNK